MESKTTIQVPDIAKGERLDKFLNKELKSISRNKILQLIKTSLILVDGFSKKASYHLQGNELITIKHTKEKNALRPFNFKVNIIYEDNDNLFGDTKKQRVSNSIGPFLNRTFHL